MMSEALEEYVIQYGQGGFLGRFRNRSERAFQRGDRVVVQTVRGLEIGTILEQATKRFASFIEPVPSGELLRGSTSEDANRLKQLTLRTQLLLDDSHRLAESGAWPLTILDGEILLDGEHAILQAIRWGECDATPLFEELSTRHSLQVLLLDLTAIPEKEKAGCGEAGCGSGGCSSCGSGGGGCSTGSCSSGKVKDAKELTAYFADLRGKMEIDTRRVSLVQ